MGAPLTIRIPDSFSMSTIGFTLGVNTKVPAKDDPTFDKSRYQNYFMILGRVHTFNPEQERTVEKIYEINTPSGGERVELVPGGIPTDTISISRYEVYRQPLLVAFGGLEANNLRSQNYPFTMLEFRFDPKDIHKSMMTQYINCYFNGFSDGIDISQQVVDVTGVTVEVGFRRSLPIFVSQNADSALSGITDTLTDGWYSFKLKSNPNGNSYNLLDLSESSAANAFANFAATNLAAAANVFLDAATSIATAGA